LSHGKTLVGALYFGRHPHGKPCYREGFNDPKEAEFARKAPMKMLKPTAWVGTGCLLIHRQVFLDIEAKFPHLARHGDQGGQWFTSSEHDLVGAVDRARAVLAKPSADTAFEALKILETGAAASRANSSLGIGEDAQFCRRAKAAGHQPYVDMGLVCGHLGLHCYGPKNTKPKQ